MCFLSIFKRALKSEHRNAGVTVRWDVACNNDNSNNRYQAFLDLSIYFGRKPITFLRRENFTLV